MLYAPVSEVQIAIGRRYYPLSRSGSSIFLEFARWPDEHGMSREALESENNVVAALAWAHTFGVLGIDSTEVTVLGDSSEAIASFLGRPGPDGFRDRGSRSQAGGGPKETIERFAGEAWEANLALRLYEAASNPDGADLDAIVHFMPDQRDGWGRQTTRERDGRMRLPGSVRDLHGKTLENARNWALGVVEEIVERKIRGRCWPIPVRDGGSHEQGWAFDSLLGAMWLQMLWLMLGQPRHCEWCGKLLDADPEVQPSEDAFGARGRKPRIDRRYCPSRNGVKDKCKADWNYHLGNGKSSKVARKRKRDHQRRTSSAG